MKKIFLFVVFALLISCSKQIDNSEIKTSADSLLNETLPTENIVLKNENILARCDVFDDNEIINEYLNITLKIEDGKVKFIDNKFDSEFYIEGINFAKNIAVNENCGGDHWFIIVENETISQFELGYRDDSKKFTANDITLTTIEYDGDMVNLYSCDDSGLTTTCGNPHFYLEKADGQKYYIDFYNKEIKLTRDEVIPYINFIEFPFAYAGYDSKVKGIAWMNDKTLRYINAVDYDEEILPNKFLNEDGNEIVAEFVYYYYETDDDSQQKVYVNIIETNGSHYTIEYDKNLVYEDKDVMPIKSDKTVSAVDYVLEDYITTKMDVYFTDGSKIEYNPENTYLLR